jgi:hypothetical protein
MTRATISMMAAAMLLASSTGAQIQPVAVGPPQPLSPVVRTVPTGAAAVPWTVALKPGMVPVPVGMCTPVYVDLQDVAKRDWPRMPSGMRVSLAEFDMTATAANGAAVVGRWNGPNHWTACACQAATAGSTITVTALYPGAASPVTSRVPGVAFRSWIEIPISIAKGQSNPPGCEDLPKTTTIAMTPPPSATTTTATTTPVATTTSTTTPVGTATPTTSTGVTATPIATTPVSVAPVAGTTTTQTGITVAPAPAPMGLVPINPSGFRAVETAPGQVVLSWQPVSAASYYVLLGPGLPGGGVKVPGATTYTATAVPGGTQQWAVASYYEPGPTSTPASEFPRVSLIVTSATTAAASPTAAPAPAASGRYLVTIVSMRAYQSSRDDILSRDGMGDEVYAAAFVRRYDRRTSALAESYMRGTTPHGDVNQFGASRIQAGSMSATGGLRDADMIPDGPVSALRSIPPQEASFPWMLWEGTLTDGADALVITPSLWEQDGSNGLHTQWAQQQQMLSSSIFTKASVQDQIAQKAFGVLVSGSSGVNGSSGLNFLGRTAVDILLLSFGVPIVNLLQTSADRPIGIVMNASAPDQTLLLTHTVVLTREIIEAALAKPALGIIPSPARTNPELDATGLKSMLAVGVLAPKPGIMVIQFQDGILPDFLGPVRPAVYQMFLQVERVP